MKKHSQATLVSIQFQRTNHQILIQYKDNGKGFSKPIKMGGGLTNTENRMHGIGGNFSFESELGKGLHVAISFPI